MYHERSFLARFMRGRSSTYLSSESCGSEGLENQDDEKSF